MDKELINRSVDYIIQHLDEDIRVGDVAEQFHFSESYFCRAFREATGESVYAFIKRLKMEQSAVDIKLIKDRSITDIGLNYGYSSSNYSSAFRKHHSVSPAQFRKAAEVTAMQNPFYPEGAANFNTFEGYAKNIQIKELGDFFVIYERIIGNYSDLKRMWPAFAQKYGDYITDQTLFIERFYDDPAIASINNCIYDICVTASEKTAPENSTVITGGKYAVFRYKGLIQDIFCSVQGVFSVWLPSSGHVMDERYGLNIYRNMDVNSEFVDMELCIPVK